MVDMAMWFPINEHHALGHTPVEQLVTWTTIQVCSGIDL